MKHPHACGEYSEAALARSVYLETPPRMWGILDRKAITEAGNGNTPTHVGNTRFRVFKQAFPQKHPHACGEYRWNDVRGKVG